jgi:uncharacterized OB-fold protein
MKLNMSHLSSNFNLNPINYTRDSREWSFWLGQRGVVMAVTKIYVSSESHSPYTPYQFAIVEFKCLPDLKPTNLSMANQPQSSFFRKSFVVADSCEVAVGDKVECVLRKLSQPTQTSIIEYGLKVSTYIDS